MAKLSLDEYRLMMGTQLWLKESLFSLINTLLGGTEGGSSKTGIEDVDRELQKVTSSFAKKGKPTVTPLNKEEGLEQTNERLKELLKQSPKKSSEQTGKQKSVATADNNERVDLSNWSLLVNDNSHKRDAKVDTLQQKLTKLKQQGYIQ